MSRVRDLPEVTSLVNADMFYVVISTLGPNGGRKITRANLKEALRLTDAEVKTAYENNADTNAFTDAEKTKLAGIETGATADQIASEVPYSNLVSGLTAINVQDAIDEVSEATLADFRPSIVSGRILHYTGGTARFDDVFFSILAGDILLDPNITLGEVYVDLDGFVKQTGSGVKAPPLTIVFAKFSTDLNNIIFLTDERVKNTQNLVRGTLSDVRDVRAGAAASAGSSGRVSDAMHKHNILTAAASTQVPDQANAEGVSTSLARADHTHNIPAGTPTTTLSPATSNAKGVAADFALSDHTHAVATSLVTDITTIQPDDTASAGTVDSFARGNHRHAIATAAPTTNLSTTTANAEGVGTSFARNDHTHAFTMATGGDLSTINAGDTESLGSTTRFVDAGHQHPVATAAASTLTPDLSNAEGNSTSLARANHIHNVPSGTPVDTGTANSAGSGSAFAKNDHVHKTVIQNYSATDTGSATTTSTTDVLMTSMQIVNPIAGDYLVAFTSSMVNSANGAERNYCSIYAGGVKVASSEIRVGTSGGAVVPVSCRAKVTVNGAQNIEVYWRVAGGTGTVYQRSVNAMKLG